MGISFNGKPVRQIFFGGRESTKVTFGNETITEKLDTPSVWTDEIDKSVSWSPVNNADKYECKRSDGYTETTSATITSTDVGLSVQVRAIGDGYLTSAWSAPTSMDTEWIRLEFTNEYGFPWNCSYTYYEGDGGTLEGGFTKETHENAECFEAFIPKGAYFVIGFASNYWENSYGSQNPFLNNGYLGADYYDVWGETDYEFDTNMPGGTVWDFSQIYNGNLGDISEYAYFTLPITAGKCEIDSDWSTSGYDDKSEYRISVVCTNRDGDVTNVVMRIGMEEKENQYGYKYYTPEIKTIQIPFGCKIEITNLSYYQNDKLVNNYGGDFTHVVGVANEHGVCICNGKDIWDNINPIIAFEDYNSISHFTDIITVARYWNS